MNVAGIPLTQWIQAVTTLATGVIAAVALMRNSSIKDQVIKAKEETIKSKGAEIEQVKAQKDTMAERKEMEIDRLKGEVERHKANSFAKYAEDASGRKQLMDDQHDEILRLRAKLGEEEAKHNLPQSNPEVVSVSVADEGFAIERVVVSGQPEQPDSGSVEPSASATG